MKLARQNAADVVREIQTRPHDHPRVGVCVHCKRCEAILRALSTGRRDNATPIALGALCIVAAVPIRQMLGGQVTGWELASLVSGTLILGVGCARLYYDAVVMHRAKRALEELRSDAVIE